MSKICDRIYGSANLLTTEEVNGILCCPLCKKPAICHNKPLVWRTLFWSLSDDTGTSSKTLARHMTGSGFQGWHNGPPSDASDRARCIRLLEIVPEWIPRLPEMVQYDQKPQEGIMINSSGISNYSNSWATQIPLIMREGGF